MVSRPLILSLLLAAAGNTHGYDGYAAANSAASPRRLRAANQAAAASASANEDGSSSQDIPDIADSRRRLQEEANVTDTAANTTATNATETNSTATNTTKEERGTITETVTVQVSQKCLTMLAQTANEYGKLKKEDYFVFTDGMSNGFFTFNNMTEYSDLPLQNKFAYVTLTCSCHAMGGSGNCCQGNRANIPVTGIDDGFDSMSEAMQAFLADVCATTMDAIGPDNILPPTGELPTTKTPTTSPAPTSSSNPSASPSITNWPTDSPSVSVWPSETPTSEPTKSPAVPFIPVEKLPGNGNNGKNGSDGGVSIGAIAGIAIAGAAVLTLMLYIVSRDRTEYIGDDENDNDDDMDAMSQQNGGKGLLAITNGELALDAPPRQDSPDATNSMTASDMSSIPSMGTSKANNTSNYYAENSLLGGKPDDESHLSSSDGPSFLLDEDSVMIEEGVEVSSDGSADGGVARAMGGLAGRDSLNTSNTSGESLDQAIESGNWEAVAASAAAIVKNNEPIHSTRGFSSMMASMGDSPRNGSSGGMEV